MYLHLSTHLESVFVAEAADGADQNVFIADRGYIYIYIYIHIYIYILNTYINQPINT